MDGCLLLVVVNYNRQSFKPHVQHCLSLLMSPISQRLLDLWQFQTGFALPVLF